ncbi:MAG: fumarylacetoacetate hydrolase family protein [SAR324 cluster bacterium]|nr:fumarylacetoacetate hydrolase family protein [SAR324 cluster bacterium]
MDLEAAIDSIWECCEQGIHYPAEWKGKLSLDDAYRIQLGILQRHLDAGQRQVGWKVGLTSQAMREQQRVKEPVFAFFLEEAAQASGTVFAYDDLIQPAFENELCLTVGTTLKGPGVTDAQARAAISGVAPSLEVPERRGEFGADIAMDIADDAQAKYFVTGAETRPVPEGLDLSLTTVEVFINGESVDRADGSAVMGNPANSVAWLANKLSEFGLVLESGMRVMSGSFTKQYAIGQGDHIESRFEPFGTVEAQFQ